jgi:hypothetical protein
VTTPSGSGISTSTSIHGANLPLTAPPSTQSGAVIRHICHSALDSSSVYSAPAIFTQHSHSLLSTVIFYSASRWDDSTHVCSTCAQCIARTWTLPRRALAPDLGIQRLYTVIEPGTTIESAQIPALIDHVPFGRSSCIALHPHIASLHYANQLKANTVNRVTTHAPLS